MRVLKLVPLLSIILFLGGEGLFLPGEAYAWCCTSCRFVGCTQPGQGGCPWFYCPPYRLDNTTSQAQAASNREILDIRGTYDSRPTTDIRLSGSSRVVAVPNLGGCSRNYFTLNLFDGNEDRLTFEPSYLTYMPGTTIKL